MNSISIFSDLICPWCYIGKRRMEQALEQMPEGHLIKVTWHPFQLNPEMPKHGMARRDYRTAKFGSWEKAVVRDEQIVDVGKTLGISFRYDLQSNTPNTFDAHRLVWLAKESGKQDAVVEALFRAYFCEGIDLSSIDNLIGVAKAAGLDAAMLEKLFEGDEGKKEIEADELHGRALGISGVPFFVINGTVAIEGAQSAGAFVEAFRQLENVDKTDGSASGSCNSDDCEIPDSR